MLFFYCPIAQTNNARHLTFGSSTSQRYAPPAVARARLAAKFHTKILSFLTLSARLAGAAGNRHDAAWQRSEDGIVALERRALGRRFVLSRLESDLPEFAISRPNPNSAVI